MSTPAELRLICAIGWFDPRTLCLRFSWQWLDTATREILWQWTGDSPLVAIGEAE